MSGYRKLLIERARAKELKQRTLIYEKQQAIIAAAAAVAAKIEGKARRRKQKAFRKYQVLATKRLQLRAILLPSIQSPSTTITTPSTSSPTRLLRTTDNGWYTGETDEKNRRHGFGCRYYKDGALLYCGNYRLARFHGYGERYAQDGRIMYRGNYLNDEPHGQGRGWSINNESYEGEWKCGIPTGQGKLYDKTTGTPYWFGKVLDWRPDGEGSLLSPMDGSVLYVGTVVKRIRHGFGTGIWPIPKKHIGKNIKSLNVIETHKSKDTEDTNESSSSDDSDEDNETNNDKDNTTTTIPSNESLRFRGNWIHGIPQGKGILLDEKDQERHIGTWLNGLLHGKGVHTYADGAVFHGEWIHGKAQGKGEWLGKDGSRLECTWVDGQRQGKGNWTGPTDVGMKSFDPIKSLAKGSRSSHRGGWEKGAMEGVGEWWGADGSHYKGNFKSNKRDGHGKLQNADGTYLVGRWKAGHLHGAGELFKKSSDLVPIYTGEFQNGKFHGKGLYSYLDYSVYQGEWIDGMRHGTGEFRIKNGSVMYEGDWKFDKQDGNGICQILGGVYKDCIYKGWFSEGKKDGQGELSTKEGKLLYKGQWKNDLFNGKGEWYPIEGNEKYVGQFKNSARHGSGTMYMENGRIYTGDWEMGEMHGNGKLTYPNGDVEKGEFEGNRFLESPENKKARFGYEPLIDEICLEMINEAREEVILWERKEAQRLVKLQWAMEDPEFEARKKIEAMRQEKLRRAEERRLKKLKEEKMKGAMLARRKREKKQKDRRSRHDNREKYSEMLKLLRGED